MRAVEFRGPNKFPAADQGRAPVARRLLGGVLSGRLASVRAVEIVSTLSMHECQGDVLPSTPPLVAALVTRRAFAQPRLPRVGVVTGGNFEAFLPGLREAGYVPGQTIVIAHRQRRIAIAHRQRRSTCSVAPDELPSVGFVRQTRWGARAARLSAAPGGAAVGVTPTAAAGLRVRRGTPRSAVGRQPSRPDRPTR